MEEELRTILLNYLEDVESACENLLDNINKIENTDLQTKWDLFNYKPKKMVYDFEGVIYQFHGIGCCRHGAANYLDWDFGYRSRWCGIDPWKVAQSLEENRSIYTKYYDGKLISQKCKRLFGKVVCLSSDNSIISK